MANRILHPANITVDTCRGYAASHTFFGDYGIGAWPERNMCYPPGTIFAPGRHGAARTVSTGAVVIGSGSSPPSSPAGNQLARDSAYNVTANITVDAQEASEMATLATLAEKALGYPLDAITLKILLDAQSVARREQEALVNLFDSGEITADDYLSRINALARSVMENYRAFLGEKQFLAIFGEAGLHPEGLIDRDVFMKSAVRKT